MQILFFLHWHRILWQWYIAPLVPPGHKNEALPSPSTDFVTEVPANRYTKIMNHDSIETNESIFIKVFLLGFLHGRLIELNLYSSSVWKSFSNYLSAQHESEP